LALPAAGEHGSVNPGAFAGRGEAQGKTKFKENAPLPQRQPIFNVPGAVLLLLGVMLAVHVTRHFLDDETELWWLIALAFVPARYSGMASEIPGGEIASFTSFVTHLFVHADEVHLAINGAWLLAFGTPLAKRLGWWRFFAFATCSGIAGALLFLAMHPGMAVPVIGASGAVAGMMGAVMRFLFSAIDRHEGWLLRDDPAAIPMMSLMATLTDRRIVVASAVFVGLNLLALIGFGTFGAAGTIAWEAHLGGYFFGLLAVALFDGAAQRRSSLPPDSPTNVA
jgi:membrane associated rhomboid family serine protease